MMAGGDLPEFDAPWERAEVWVLSHARLLVIDQAFACDHRRRGGAKLANKRTSSAWLVVPVF